MDIPKNPSVTEHAEKLIKALIKDLCPLVRKIEASPPITKDYYGDYLSVLSEFPKGNYRLAVAIALMRAGANKQGVYAALSLC